MKDWEGWALLLYILVMALSIGIIVGMKMPRRQLERSARDSCPRLHR